VPLPRKTRSPPFCIVSERFLKKETFKLGLKLMGGIGRGKEENLGPSK
jgi:hypothetical protein